MRSLARSIGLACVAVAFTAGAVLAVGRPTAGCPVGPADTGTATIAAWEAWDSATFAAALEDAGFSSADAGAVYDKEDKNDDGILCVEVQELPNDASGSDIWFVSKDNTSQAR